MKLIDNDGNIKMNHNIPYGSILKIGPGKKVKKGDVITNWDPYNGVIIAESAGKVEFENIQQGVTYQLEIDEQTGFQERSEERRVGKECRDRRKPDWLDNKKQNIV